MFDLDPLALLASIAGLSPTGNTFNLMTLGGLMLAIGILVDNALVEIENINRNLEAGLGLREAILKSASEVAFPEFVSTVAICIVFSPIFLLTGTAAFVFVPMALCGHVRHGGVVRSCRARWCLRSRA